jgi:hypothetical protein
MRQVADAVDLQDSRRLPGVSLDFEVGDHG